MSGYLKDKRVYLCGPLGCVDDDGVGWRNDLTPRLESLGLIVDDPTKSVSDEGIGEVGDDKKKFREIILREDFKELKEQFWPIVRKDLRSVDKSDFLIVNYDSLAPTVGTYDECTRASVQKKPILLKYDKNQLDTFNPWVVTWVKENEIFSSWDDLFDYLENTINKGDYASSRWTL